MDENKYFCLIKNRLRIFRSKFAISVFHYCKMLSTIEERNVFDFHQMRMIKFCDLFDWTDNNNNNTCDETYLKLKSTFLLYYRYLHRFWDKKCIKAKKVKVWREGKARSNAPANCKCKMDIKLKLRKILAT